MPKISVVMPAYNHASFVGQAVESVLKQSLDDLELLVYDDASTDETANVVRSIKDKRVFLTEHTSNQGASSAVNAALRRTKGDYIAILNSDDYFLPGKLECQAQFLDNNPSFGAVFGWQVFVDEQGEALPDEKNPFRNRLKRHGNHPREWWLHHFFTVGNALCQPTVMIRKTCYEDVGVYDPRLAQLADYDLWIRLCTRHDIHILPQVVTAYRVLESGGNASAGHANAKRRHDWELQYVFRRYLALSDEELRRIFATEFAELDPDGRQLSKVLLGRLALKLGPSAWAASAYLAFGLDTLWQALGESSADISPSEYAQLTGYYEALAGPSAAGVETDRLRSTIERLEQDLKALRSSSSWRLTAPMRIFADGLKSHRRNSRG